MHAHYCETFSALIMLLSVVIKYSTIIPNADGVDEKERLMRERRPNPQNVQELLGLMEETRAVRRHWILTAKPHITSVLKRYPRFLDINAAVCLTFS